MRFSDETIATWGWQEFTEHVCSPYIGGNLSDADKAECERAIESLHPVQLAAWMIAANVTVKSMQERIAALESAAHGA